MIKQTVWTLELIKFSHSIFALPFALSSMLVAAGGWPGLHIFSLIVVAMVTARSAAMAFNRVVDAEIDARNSRTKTRHLPQGLLSKKYVSIFTLICSALFIFTCYHINNLAFVLSPVALFILLGYSFSKRFTWASHFWLGLSLGMAAPAAWIAVRGELATTPLWLGTAVLFWVAGFDIIYATQDYEFDRQNGGHSVVVRFGIANALKISRICHCLAVLFLLFFGASASLGMFYWLVIFGVAGALWWEQSLVKADDLSRVNAAFFTANGLISLSFLIGIGILIFYP